MENQGTYQNFVFYGSMRESVDALPEELGNKLLRAIMNYGTDGEIDRSDVIIYAILCSIIPNINKAKERYSASVMNGDKGGRPTLVSREQVKQLLDAGNSVAEVAQQLNCSTSTVYDTEGYVMAKFLKEDGGVVYKVIITCETKEEADRLVAQFKNAVIM